MWIITDLNQSFSRLRRYSKVFFFRQAYVTYIFRLLLVHASFFNWKADFLLGFFITRISLCGGIPIVWYELFHFTMRYILRTLKLGNPRDFHTALWNVWRLISCTKYITINPPSLFFRKEITMLKILSGYATNCHTTFTRFNLNSTATWVDFFGSFICFNCNSEFNSFLQSIVFIQRTIIWIIVPWFIWRRFIAIDETKSFLVDDI